MKYGQLILEKKEYVYLKRLLNISEYSNDCILQKSLQRLTDQLKTALVVDDFDVPEDIIRFNNLVRLQDENGFEKEIKLVIPSEEDASQNKLSVLKPLGAALIGCAADDNVTWELPSGSQIISIQSVRKDANYKPIDVLI